MRHSTVTNLIAFYKKGKSKGVTLIEILIAMILVGVLAALGLPQLFALFSRNKVQTGLDMAQGALQDAQRQAIRRSQACTLQLHKSNSSNTYYDLLAAENGCFGALAAQFRVIDSADRQTVQLPDEVRMATNISGTNPAVQFSFRGHTPGLTFTPPANQATIVIFPFNQNTNAPYDPNDSRNEQKCLVISSLLGVVRTGVYEPRLTNSSTTIQATNCTTSIDGMQR